MYNDVALFVKFGSLVQTHMKYAARKFGLWAVRGSRKYDAYVITPEITCRIITLILRSYLSEVANLGYIK